MPFLGEMQALEYKSSAPKLAEAVAPKQTLSAEPVTLFDLKASGSICLDQDNVLRSNIMDTNPNLKLPRLGSFLNSKKIPQVYNTIKRK